MPVTFIASTSQVLWRILEARGHDPLPVFRDAGLDPARWHEADARFPDAALGRAWAAATTLCNDPCIGLLAARFVNPASLHALGFAWLASDTLHDALARLVRHSRLISDGMELSLSLSGSTCCLSIERVDLHRAALAQRTDSFWAGLITLCRTISGESLAPTRVTLRRPAPDCAADYYALFRSAVEFGAARDSLSFDRAVAERPLATANRALARANEQAIEDYLARLDANSLPDRVRTRLVETLPGGTPGEASVARALNLTPRTLQRRLAAHGTSFKVLLDEARRELAMRFIGERRLSIKEASYLLGFSEPANFARAFKRWTGSTPSVFRESRPA